MILQLRLFVLKSKVLVLISTMLVLKSKILVLKSTILIRKFSTLMTQMKRIDATVGTPAKQYRFHAETMIFHAESQRAQRVIYCQREQITVFSYKNYLTQRHGVTERIDLRASV